MRPPLRDPYLWILRLDTDLRHIARGSSLRGSLRKMAGSPLRGSATGASSGIASSASAEHTCVVALPFTSGDGSCALAMAAAREAASRTSAFLHAAFYAGPAHAAKLHARLIHMATPCALCASGLVAPSLRLPPFQPHTARAAKFIFRTIFSPAEGTKHEAL